MNKNYNDYNQQPVFIYENDCIQSVGLGQNCEVPLRPANVPIHPAAEC